MLKHYTSMHGIRTLVLLLVGTAVGKSGFRLGYRDLSRRVITISVSTAFLISSQIISEAKMGVA